MPQRVGFWLCSLALTGITIESHRGTMTASWECLQLVTSILVPFSFQMSQIHLVCSFMFSVIHKHQLKERRKPFALNTHFIIIFSADEHFTSGLFNVGSWFNGYICSWKWWKSKLWRYRFFETKEPRGLLGTYDNRRHRSRISDLSMAHWSSTGTIYKYHVDRFQVINTPLKVNVHNSLCLQWHTLVK